MRFLPAVEYVRLFRLSFKADDELMRLENLCRHWLRRIYISREGGKRKFDEVNLHSRYRAKTMTVCSPKGFYQ